MKICACRILLALALSAFLQPLFAQSSATLDVSPVLLDFGEVGEGGSSRQSLTLSNLTALSLDVTEFSQTGSASFVLDPLGGAKPCGSQTPRIAAGDHCTFEVVFSPEFSEVASGTMTFTPNAEVSKAITVRMQGETPAGGGGCSLNRVPHLKTTTAPR